MDHPESRLLSRLQQAQRLCSQRLEHLDSAAMRHELTAVLAVLRDAEQVLTTWGERIASLSPEPEHAASTPDNAMPLGPGEAALPSPHFLEEMTTLAADLFTRHGITEDETDILWNYYAALAFESVWNQEGVFYEKVKRLFAPPPG